MKKPSKSAPELAAAIHKAMEDLVITNAEYERILAIAERDGHVDSQEAALLRELQHMIENGTVVRRP